MKKTFVYLIKLFLLCVWVPFIPYFADIVLYLSDITNINYHYYALTIAVLISLYYSIIVWFYIKIFKEK